jgi:hypothetical protein
MQPSAETPQTHDGKPSVPSAPVPAAAVAQTVPEIGGPRGPETTRYGDWEKRGRCIDF